MGWRLSQFSTLRSTQLSYSYYFLPRLLRTGLFYACLFCCCRFILISMDHCHGMNNIFKTATTIPSIIAKTRKRAIWLSCSSLNCWTNSHCIFSQSQHHFSSDHSKTMGSPTGEQERGWIFSANQDFMMKNFL